jgi:hypothetical protein
MTSDFFSFLTGHWYAIYMGHVGGLSVSCDRTVVFQLCLTGQWFSPGLPVSSTNKTDRRDITEILLKVALNTIKSNQS